MGEKGRTQMVTMDLLTLGGENSKRSFIYTSFFQGEWGWDWDLNSAGPLLLEPHLQSILLWLFLRMSLEN
jgi:hypothetical protein